MQGLHTLVKGNVRGDRKICNSMAAKEIAPEITAPMRAVKIIALSKTDGGFSTIEVGEILRREITNTTAKAIKEDVKIVTGSIQCAGLPGVCEAAIAPLRRCMHPVEPVARRHLSERGPGIDEEDDRREREEAEHHRDRADHPPAGGSRSFAQSSPPTSSASIDSRPASVHARQGRVLPLHEGFAKGLNQVRGHADAIVAHGQRDIQHVGAAVAGADGNRHAARMAHLRAELDRV